MIKTYDNQSRYDPARSRTMDRIHILTRALECIEVEAAVTDATSLAGHMGYSRSHLDRLFLDAIGDTPASLIRDERMRQAAHELTTTRKRIVDIALDCGFASQEAFTRAFRRTYRRTPDEYRHVARPPSLQPRLSLRPHARVPTRVCVVQVWSAPAPSPQGRGLG